MEPLVIYLARWRFILLALLMLPFSLAGLFMLTIDELVSRVMGFGFLVLFGGFTVFALVKIVQHKPVITLSDAGIEDTRLKIGVIPWSEVVQAYELPYLWYKNVQVLVRHPEQFKQRQPWLTRTLGELNAMSGWSPFVLMTANTSTSASVVVDYICRQLVRHWPTAPDAPTRPVLAEEEGGY
jgi:hypothetical protein